MGEWMNRWMGQWMNRCDNIWRNILWNYLFQCFEGMKAFRGTNDGKIRLFRPMKNMKRFNDSAIATSLPVKFILTVWDINVNIYYLLALLYVCLIKNFWNKLIVV